MRLNWHSADTGVLTVRRVNFPLIASGGVSKHRVTTTSIQPEVLVFDTASTACKSNCQG